ncbi:hypothetical protein M8818_006645 [Zalaria obscura]|uniref:Uncharacterized protein n=1 Tax=Zalaria obscura TaxID=2024903 RepID=A0ACC3S4S0_9PEZI
MTAPPLTVRNLTSSAIELKLVERYRAPDSQEPKLLSNFTRSFTSFVANTTAAPSAPQLAQHAQSFASQEVSIRIEPFKAHQTDISISERSAREVLRLTFENDGQRYRIDTPTPDNASQTLTPLSPNPKRQYTGVFLPESSFLALYSSANLNCWMRELSDPTPLSAISIPGTHNSPTHHKALPSVRCQAVSTRVQLENGVRFLDIRVQPESPDDPSKDALILVHGVFPISLTGPKYFRSLLQTVQDFLAANPSETVMMSVKREGPGNATDHQLSLILREHYTAGQTDKFWTHTRVPTLGEARGKIVLLRRFALHPRLATGDYSWDGHGWALDAENWAYNTPNDTHGAVCVQDFCEVLETVNIDKKISYCCDHFERAGKAVCPIPGITTDAVNPVPPGPLYLNFLSASNFWKMGCWPEKIAAKLNPAIVKFLCMKHDAEGGLEGDGGVGIVVTDWVGHDGDWDLIRCIVGMNARLEMREKEGK